MSRKTATIREHGHREDSSSPSEYLKSSPRGRSSDMFWPQIELMRQTVRSAKSKLAESS